MNIAAHHRDSPMLARAAYALLSVASLIPVTLIARENLAAPALLGIIVVAAGLTPYNTLLFLAAICGIAPAIAPGLLGWPSRAAELLPLAFLAGTFARYACRRPVSAPTALPWALGAVASVVVISAGIGAALTAVVLSRAGLDGALREFANTFLDGSRTFPYLVAAIQTLTALGLCVVASQVAADRPHTLGLMRMTAVGAAAVAAMSVTRMLEVVLRAPRLSDGLEILRHLRVSAPYGDVNATGSVFALAIPIAWFAFREERGRRRPIPVILLGLLAVGLWLTGSRTALAAVGVWVLAVAIRRTAASRKALASTLLAAVAAVAFMAWLFPNPLVDRFNTVGAAQIRVEMGSVALRMWKSDPLLGIGYGSFLNRSGAFITNPYVRQLYGRENAHNNFLQVLAELGVLGVAACLLALVVALTAASPPGLRTGLILFLVTCLTGHPLLIADVQFVFALVVGATAAYERTTLVGWIKPASLVIAAAALVAAPQSYRVERAQLDLEHLGYGVSQWQQDSEGHRFQTSDGDATLFVPATAVELHFSIKNGIDQPETVRIELDGRLANVVRLTPGDWRPCRMTMPPSHRNAFVPLHLTAVNDQGTPAPFLIDRIDALNRQ